MRLSDHLAALDLKGAAARKAMGTGKVFVHGIPTSDAGREVEAHAVEYRPSAARLTPGRDLVIVHKDDDLVVVWKPSGLLSVKAAKEGGHLNVVGLVSKLIGGTALAVHRLDEGTSGLMMVARNIETQQHLKSQLEVHSVERRYVAMVLGTPQESKWTVSNHLMQLDGEGRRGSVTGKPPRDAKFAKTMFTHLGRAGKRISLVEAVLHTGRTHQVRIHLSEGGFPIIGDEKYGNPTSARAAERVCLHAVVLGIEHPRTGEKMRFTSPLPDDMEQLRRRLLRGPEKPARAKGPPRKKPKKSKSKKRR